jgi:hypothetical protein
MRTGRLVCPPGPRVLTALSSVSAASPAVEMTMAVVVAV